MLHESLGRTFSPTTYIVMTSYLLRVALHSPDTAGRMMKWAVELGEYGLEYQPRTAIKSQVLADFVAEFTGTTQGLESEPIIDDELEGPTTGRADRYHSN